MSIQKCDPAESIYIFFVIICANSLLRCRVSALRLHAEKQLQLQQLGEGPNQSAPELLGSFPACSGSHAYFNAQRILIFQFQKCDCTHSFIPCANKEVSIAVPGAISMSKPILNCHFVRIFEEEYTISVENLPSNYTLTQRLERTSIISRLG